MVGEIGGELAERHQIVFFAAAVGYIGKIGQRVVALYVGIVAASSVTGGRQALGVGLEGFSCGEQVADNVVLRKSAAQTVVVGDGLAGGEHEVIADRRMSVGVVLRGQTILGGQAIQVWHRRASDDTGVAVVLLENDKHVGAERHRRRSRAGH